MIGRSGERGSGISVLAARHDDDGDDYKQAFRNESVSQRYWTPGRSKVSHLYSDIHDGLVNLRYLLDTLRERQRDSKKCNAL